MYFLLAGIAALLMKYLEFGPVAAWSWWVTLSPFGMAVVWWTWADSSGYTQRKELEKMDKRRQNRLDKQRQQMGTLSSKRKK